MKLNEHEREYEHDYMNVSIIVGEPLEEGVKRDIKDKFYEFVDYLKLKNLEVDEDPELYFSVYTAKMEDKNDEIQDNNIKE